MGGTGTGTPVTGYQADYLTAIGSIVGGSLPLGDTEKGIALAQAVKEHSKQRPKTEVEEESGTGGFDYALTLLAAWVEGFSVIKQVEYPVDDTDENLNFLLDNAWRIYQKPTGKVLRFLEDKPAATEKIRVTYTSLHICTNSINTIETFDEEAVQFLAAGYFCDMLSTYFAQNQDSTIAADSVSHTSKSRDYAARAVVYKKIYFDHLGIKEGETLPASVNKNQDMRGSWGGDKMTHPQRYR